MLAGIFPFSRLHRYSSDIFRYVFLGIFGPIFLIVLFVIIVNLLQVHATKYLPHRLQTWSWLPRPFRTLSWYDEYLCSRQKRLICCHGNESNKAAIIANRNMQNSTYINKTFDDIDSDRLSGISTRL